MRDLWLAILDILDVLEQSGLGDEADERLAEIRKRVPIRTRTLSRIDLPGRDSQWP